MEISAILNFLETLAPLNHQEDYDNCGLQVGNPDKVFEKALLCLEVTPAIMEEAVSRGCNLVVSHHPLIFRGLKKLTPAQPETAVICSAMVNQIAVYAIHTNLDNQLRGLNGKVAGLLGITGQKVLSPRPSTLMKLVTFCPVEHAATVREAMFAAGAGHIGNYDSCSYNVRGTGTFRGLEGSKPFVGTTGHPHEEDETRIEVVVPSHLKGRVTGALLNAHPYEEVAYDLYRIENESASTGAGITGTLETGMNAVEFLELVKTRLHLKVLRHSRIVRTEVMKIALCTGSGSFLIPEAIRAGADVFLTGDCKYHDFTGLNDRIVLADIGHYESEQWVKEWLYDALIEKFPNFAFLISEVETNPVNYL